MIFRCFFIFLLLFSFESYSYPNFIGKGYQNCLTCHYNPFGNGPLNDYGRGVAASGLAGRFLIPEKISDEKLSNISGFMFNKQDKQLLKPAIDYRGGNIYSNLEAAESGDKWINMQLDASLSAEFGKKKEYVTSATYSIIPFNSVAQTKAEAYSSYTPGEDLTFWRELYIGRKINKENTIYIGKMDKVFGIRIPDHNVYARSVTGNTQYGGVHGVMLHHFKEKYDLGVQLYLGDLEKVEEQRSQGLTSKFEYSLNDKIRVGASFLTQSNEDTEKLAYSGLVKMRIGKGSSLMSEIGRVTDTPNGADPITQQYILIQNHYYLKRGLYFVTTYENINQDISNESEQHRFAPGILYFPVQRVELRADLYNLKNYTQSTSANDTWTLVGQLHLWF